MYAALAVPRDGPRSLATDPGAAAVDTGDRQPIASVDEIETAFLRHAPALLRYLYARTGRKQDAEDLLGDVFVQAWRYRGRIAHLDHWLFTVARHRANRFLGRRGRETPIEDVETGAVEPRRHMFDPAAPEMVAFFALSDADREILVLHGLSERPMPEVALILDISEAAAWQRWQRARDRYFEHLVAVGVHPPDGWRKPRRAAGTAVPPSAAEAGPTHQEDAQHDV